MIAPQARHGQHLHTFDVPHEGRGSEFLGCSDNNTITEWQQPGADLDIAIAGASTRCIKTARPRRLTAIHLVSHGVVNGRACFVLETHSQGEDGGYPNHAKVAKPKVKIAEETHNYLCLY